MTTALRNAPAWATSALWGASRVLSIAAVAALGIGCNGSAAAMDAGNGADESADSATDAAIDVSTADVFSTAPHNPLPIIAPRGGPTMSTVQLVVITYADTPNAEAIGTFGGWIGGSDWLATVGEDYGVESGTLLGIVQLPDDAPDSISSTEIETMIADGVTSGAMPSPTDHDYGNVIYMVFFPEHTTIHQILTGAPTWTSCRQFDGFHSEFSQGPLHLVYSVIADCGAARTGTEFGGQTSTAAHEYIEAATDPYLETAPAYELPADGSSSWAFIGGEVADMCELGSSTYLDDAYSVVRVWSNSAALTDHDPCVVASPTAGPYFNVSVEPFDAQFASDGDTVTFALTGWSIAPVADWGIDVFQEGGDLSLTATLDEAMLQNGGTATVTVNVPAGTPQGFAEFEVSSTSTAAGRTREVWLLTVVVE